MKTNPAKTTQLYFGLIDDICELNVETESKKDSRKCYFNGVHVYAARE